MSAEEIDHIPLLLSGRFLPRVVILHPDDGFDAKLIHLLLQKVSEAWMMDATAGVFRRHRPRCHTAHTEARKTRARRRRSNTPSSRIFLALPQAVTAQPPNRLRIDRYHEGRRIKTIPFSSTCAIQKVILHKQSQSQKRTVAGGKQPTTGNRQPTTVFSITHATIRLNNHFQEGLQ